MPERPDFLTGQDGDVVFVPRDLAESATEARACGLREGYNLTGFEVDEVEMLPVPEHFTGLDVEWATVVPGTPTAIKFWRFQL